MALYFPFSVSSNTQPTMTVNHMVYALYKQSSPLAIVTSQAFAPPHGARQVFFPALERTNWKFQLLETLPDNVTVVRVMDSYNFVPGTNTPLWYDPVEIEADVTPGVVSGTNTFTFDGTAGTFDWRGREIYSERVGLGTMKKTVQYSWDPVTGIFTLLTALDVFQPNELFNVEFGVVNAMAGVVVPPLFTDTMVITGAVTLVAADAGKNIIIKGLSAGFDITLPDITTVVDSVPFYFESGIGSHKMVRIKTAGGQIIDWLKGSLTDLKIGVCESLTIYKEKGTSVWRVHNGADGNFKTVGRMIITDADISVQEFNIMELIGGTYSITGAGRRLYEDYVQKLPPSQVCSFAVHGTGVNKYLYSYASGDNAYLPDMRDLYVRNSSGANLPGVYQGDNVGSFSGNLGLQHATNPYSGLPNVPRVANPGTNNIAVIDHPFTYTAVIPETRVKGRIVRIFVLT